MPTARSTSAQFTWLKQVIDSSADKLVILFSHHTSGTMANPLVAHRAATWSRGSSARPW